MTVALTLDGTLEFIPLTDGLQCSDGSELEPVIRFDPGEDTFQVRGQDLNLCAL